MDTSTLDTHKLKILLKVYELKSFSKAAKQMYLTQPTISQHIQALEVSIGAKLFDRFGKEVRPTRAGDILYRYAKQIISLTGEAKDSLEHFLGKKSGRLVLGASTIPGEYILPTLLGNFKQHYPAIKLTLRIADTEGVVDDLINNKTEMGIVGAKIRNPRLQFSRFFDEELVVVVPRGHRWWNRSSVDVPELAAEQFIMREPGSGTRTSMEKSLHAMGLSPEQMNIIAEMGSTTAVKQAVKAQLGISIMSELAIADEIQQKTLKKISIKNTNLQRTFYIIREKKRTLSPLCKALLDFLTEYKETLSP